MGLTAAGDGGAAMAERLSLRRKRRDVARREGWREGWHRRPRDLEYEVEPCQPEPELPSPAPGQAPLPGQGPAGKQLDFIEAELAWAEKLGQRRRERLQRRSQQVRENTPRYAHLPPVAGGSSMHAPWHLTGRRRGRLPTQRRRKPGNCGGYRGSQRRSLGLHWRSIRNAYQVAMSAVLVSPVIVCR
jgi:hypothetical protein